jgi:plastocyanin
VNDSLFTLDPATGEMIDSNIPGSKIVNVTIPYGTELLPGNQTFQPNIVRIKVGDIVQWINEDWQIHDFMSPPGLPDSPAVARGLNFHCGIFSQGQSCAIGFSRPGGFHYAESLDLRPGAIGTIIVEE